MKVDNLSKEIVTSYVTFHSLIIPAMILSQLGNAAWFHFAGAYVNNQLGARRALVFVYRHGLVSMCFLFMAKITGQLRFPKKRELPCILIAGTMAIFYRSQLISRALGATSPWYVALWLPISPVILQIAVIIMGMEKGNKNKYIGCAICTVSCMLLVIYYQYAEDAEIFPQFFWFTNLMTLPGVGQICVKKAMMAEDIGIFNLGFWNFFIAMIGAFFHYGGHYWVNDFGLPFLDMNQIFGLYIHNPMIWFTLILTDCINQSGLMYIAQTGQISKASIYSTLSPIFNL